MAAWQAPLWRIQSTPKLAPRRYPAPRFRFDAPEGEFAAIYACADPLATFAETYRDRGRRLGPEDGDRHLLRLVPTRPLPVIDLRDERLRVALGVDERVSVGDDYTACQAWSGALFTGLPDAAGIAYRSRLSDARGTNVVLFAERCADSLNIETLGQLATLEPLVLAAADRFGLTVYFPFV